MVREIVFDTETTGLKFNDDDRVVEIGAIELWNHIPTGKTYHQYINPKRGMPEEAKAVHGLSDEFLAKFPGFEEIADEFLEFIGDAILVAHNASFDINFLNAEFKRANRELLEWGRVVDTLEMARRLYPGARNNLDALCKRLGVDNSDRTLHGALLDSQILAKVYYELLGGIEPKMALEIEAKKAASALSGDIDRKFREPRNFGLSAEELAAHEEFMKKIKEPVWG